MKCPVCWTEKVYLRIVKGWKARLLLSVRLAVPMRCHHCYHRFWAPWFLTIGKQLQPPEKIAPTEELTRPFAARYLLEQQSRCAVTDVMQAPEREERAAA